MWTKILILRNYNFLEIYQTRNFPNKSTFGFFLFIDFLKSYEGKIIQFSI